MATILRGSDNLDSSKVVSEELAGSIVTDASGNVSLPYQPSISRYLNSNTSVLVNATISKIPFDVSRHQQGISYNPSTYAFTVPVAGKYLVTASARIQNSGGHAGELSICKNGSYHVYVYNNNINPYDGMSVSAVIDMQANDYLDVRMWQDSGLTLSVSGNGSGVTTFTAMLIG